MADPVICVDLGHRQTGFNFQSLKNGGGAAAPRCVTPIRRKKRLIIEVPAACLLASVRRCARSTLP
jgi:hypothetical protein